MVCEFFKSNDKLKELSDALPYQSSKDFRIVDLYKFKNVRFSLSFQTNYLKPDLKILVVDV